MNATAVFAAFAAQVLDHPGEMAPAPTPNRGSGRAPTAAPDPFAAAALPAGSATPGEWRAGDDLGSSPAVTGGWRAGIGHRPGPVPVTRAPTPAPAPAAVRPPPTLDHAAFAQRRRGG